MASASPLSITNSFGVFHTMLDGKKYAKSAFDLFNYHGARSIGIIVDIAFVDQAVNICGKNGTLETAKLYPNITVFGYFELPPFNLNGGADYIDSLTAILTAFKSNGVETVLGCSYQQLCVQVLLYISNLRLIIDLIMNLFS